MIGFVDKRVEEKVGLIVNNIRIITVINILWLLLWFCVNLIHWIMRSLRSNGI